MALLLLGTLWILTLALIAGLCVAARGGDLQHQQQTSPAARESIHPNSLVTITRVEHRSHTAPDFVASGLAETAASAGEALAAEPSCAAIACSGWEEPLVSETPASRV